MLISDGMPRTDGHSLCQWVSVCVCDAVNYTTYLFQTQLSLVAFRSDSFPLSIFYPLPLGARSNSMLTTNDCIRSNGRLSWTLHASRVSKSDRNGRIQICRTGMLDIWENTNGQFWIRLCTDTGRINTEISTILYGLLGSLILKLLKSNNRKMSKLAREPHTSESQFFFLLVH